MTARAADPNRVALALMKSDEADATIAVLRARYPTIVVEDNTTYWSVQSVGEIVVDMAEVSEELGEPITVDDWLVIMATYIGRASHEDNALVLSSRMLQLDSSPIFAD